MNILKISFKEWLLLFEAIWTLIVVKVHYRLYSFSKLLKLYTEKGDTIAEDLETIYRIKRTIQRIGKLPIGKNRCLVLSLAGRRMLTRRNINSSLLIGTQNSTDAPDFGHAWLISHGIEVVDHSADHDKIAEF